MEAIVVAVFIVSIAVALAVASLLWGADSREGLDSPEWARRKEWYGKVAR